MGRRLHLGPLLGGFALLLACIRFLSVYPTHAKFGGAIDGGGRILSHIGPGEFRLWLAVFLLGVPACIAIACGFERLLGPVLGDWMRRFDTMTPSAWRASALLYFAALLVIAQVGNGLLLLGHQITDDESGVRFGGQLWAAGQTMVPALEPPGAWNDIYMYRRGNMVGSMDWPLVIGVSAIATITGLGTSVYAILAALTGLAVAVTGRRLFGSRGAPIAGLVWLVSPMAFSLSITNHAHVISRCWVALAVYLFTRLCTPLPREDALRGGIALGFIVGLGACTRPIETGALLAPAGCMILYLAFHNRGGHRRALVGCGLGIVGPLVAHAIYNQHMTGNPLSAPRLSDSILGVTPSATLSVWDRFGANLGHNLLMLSVWLWGPAGIALAWIGSCRRSPVLRTLSVGVALSLLVALAHTDVGIHTVGPIHYSEAAVPLTLLLVGGIVSALHWLRDRGVEAHAPASALLGYCAAMALFILQYSGSLRLSGEFLDLPYAVLRHHEVHNGVILTPPPAMRDVILQTSVGSWQLKDPAPDPRLEDPILFARWDSDVAALHTRLPKRDIYRMYISRLGAKLVKLDPTRPEVPLAMPGAPAPHP